MTAIKKRIGIDCRLSGPQNAGIGRYIENLITRLPKLATNIEWVFTFMDHDQAKRVQKKVGDNLNNVSFRVIPIRHYTFGEQIKLPLKFRQQQLDLLHVPHFNSPAMYRRPLVVTIHDLLWHKQTGLHMTTLKPWQYHLKYLAYRFVTRQSVNKAAKIIVPAQTVKQAVCQYFPQVKSKIEVVHEGYNPAFRQSKLQQDPKNQIIYVGSLYPHKNLQLIFRALTQLPHLKLKIIGSRKIFKDRLVELSRKLDINQQLEWMGYVKDQDLAKILNQSLALVQPSISEGFGLTGIEAMAARTAVLASDIPTFKEIYQHAPIYFNPHSVTAAVEAIKQIRDPKTRQKHIHHGNQIVQNYSWDEMAQQTLEAYQTQLKS